VNDGPEIESLLALLETLTNEAECNRAKWRDVWSEVKGIGQAFKESRFPSVQDRHQSWNRFQSIIARIKVNQERARTEFEQRTRESEFHLNQLRSYAWKATPSSGLADVLLTILTAGTTLVIEAILGPYDQRKLELQRCSEAVKEGWAYLSQNKGKMLGKHKKEAFDALTHASESLRSAWDTWKSGKQQALDQYYSEKRKAWEARQAKREEWETRMRDNIAKLEDRLGRLEDVRGRRQENLNRLEDMLCAARSDSYRDRVEGWIDEERERINEIENKIHLMRGWLSEMRAKLD